MIKIEYVGNNPVNFVDPLGLMHGGFIKQVAKMANKSLKRTIRSLEKQIAKHESKNPSKHHKHELRIFEEQLKLAKGEAKRRGLSALSGIGLAGSGKCENMSQEEAEEMTENWFDWFDPFGSSDYAY